MPPMTDEIHSLRQEMNARLTQVEKWLERVTVAMEKLTDNRERLLVLEVRMKAELERQDRDLAAIREAHGELRVLLRDLSVENNGQNITITKLSTFKAGMLSAITIVGSGLISWLVKIWGN